MEQRTAFSKAFFTFRPRRYGTRANGTYFRPKEVWPSLCLLYRQTHGYALNCEGHLLYRIVYYIILHYIILYYIILYYTICYDILYDMICYDIVLYYIILYYIILYYIILYYIILYYIYQPRNGLHYTPVHHKTRNTLKSLRGRKISHKSVKICWLTGGTLSYTALQWNKAVTGRADFPKKSLFIACFQQDSPVGLLNLKILWLIVTAQRKADRRTYYQYKAYEIGNEWRCESTHEHAWL